MNQSDKFKVRLKDRRAASRLSQKKLANKAGVSVTTIQKYESGASWPKAPHLVSLANILDCSIDWLLTGEGPMVRSRMNSSTFSENHLPDDRLCLMYLIFQAINELNNKKSIEDKLTIKPEKINTFIDFIEENAWNDWKETVQELIEALVKALPHLKK